MTYSFAAVDPTGSVIGLAVASYSLAVGAGVPALDPAVGAVVTQAWTNRLLRHRVLTALRAGLTPEAALASAVTTDEGARFRQVALIDITGETAVWTGEETSAWAGARCGPRWIAAGNLLTGPEVLDAMAGGYGAPSSPRFTDAPAPPADPDPDGDDTAVRIHAERLLAVLAAGQRAGGDRRGQQSCALQVARIQSVSLWPPQLLVDLRVDDAAEPLSELARLVQKRWNDLIHPSNGVTAPRTIVTPSEALAHQWGVEQP